ncbi:hypothetical protein AF72_04530 [Xylella taiwanensis]|uniref:Uncharacterized protein n=1 Tax=Xylella taiwanensis TaxID=1444770 RepID=Z9JJP2_9GAMM|nr:hypothetical protein AF72_04530 [Xylella taiwanensis]
MHLSLHLGVAAEGKFVLVRKEIDALRWEVTAEQ